MSLAAANVMITGLAAWLSGPVFVLPNRLLKKPVAFSTTLTIPRIACAMLRNCTGF